MTAKSRSTERANVESTRGVIGLARCGEGEMNQKDAPGGGSEQNTNTGEAAATEWDQQINSIASLEIIVREREREKQTVC